jgi:hypothetical protein
MSAMKRLFAVMVAVIGMVIAAASIGVAASAYPPGTGPTISTSTSTVPQGGSLTVFGDNFSPNSDAVLSLHSTPVGLGTVHTDSNGQFSAQVTVPSTTSPGTHTIEALDMPTGDIASATITVTAGGTGGGGGGGGGGGVAETGVAVISIGALGLVLLVGGGLMLMAGRRRKVTA